MEINSPEFRAKIQSMRNRIIVENDATIKKITEDQEAEEQQQIIKLQRKTEMIKIANLASEIAKIALNRGIERNITFTAKTVIPPKTDRFFSRERYVPISLEGWILNGSPRYDTPDGNFYSSWTTTPEAGRTLGINGIYYNMGRMIPPAGVMLNVQLSGDLDDQAFNPNRNHGGGPWAMSSERFYDHHIKTVEYDLYSFVLRHSLDR